MSWATKSLLLATGASLALALLGLLCPVWIGATEIAVVFNPALRPHVEALAGFQDASNLTVRHYYSPSNGSQKDGPSLAKQINRRSPDLVLAMGPEALLNVAGQLGDIPTIFCWVLPPAGLIERSPNLTGISIMPDPEQLANVLDQLIPGPLRVGVVYERRTSSDLIDAARSALAQFGKVLDAVPAEEGGNLPKQVKQLLDRVDVYWMIPDRVIRNRDVMRFLLFASRSQKKPLIGPSEKFVKAGALFALTPDSRGIGRQAAKLAQTLLENTATPLPPVQPTRSLNLSINAEVIEMLDIQVPDQLIEKVLDVR